MNDVDSSLVQQLLNAGLSYHRISEELKQHYPSIRRGLSERSVRRYVKECGLRDQAKLFRRASLEQAISEVEIYL